jgi:hypothetical protein
MRGLNPGSGRFLNIESDSTLEQDAFVRTTLHRCVHRSGRKSAPPGEREFLGSPLYSGFSTPLRGVIYSGESNPGGSADRIYLTGLYLHLAFLWRIHISFNDE